jgi:hypothetical protein
MLGCRINNAGSNGYKYKTLLESSDADLVSIVETNVLGVMLGCKEARCLGWPCVTELVPESAGGHMLPFSLRRRSG